MAVSQVDNAKALKVADEEAMHHEAMKELQHPTYLVPACSDTNQLESPHRLKCDLCPSRKERQKWIVEVADPWVRWADCRCVGSGLYGFFANMDR